MESKDENSFGVFVLL